MIKRLFAIGFIFACVSVAWMILAGATSTRTNSADSSLKSRVSQLWGAPQAQLPPHIVTEEKIRRKVESVENGNKVEKIIDDVIIRPIAIDSSDIKVDLKLDHRQKGLLWYSTYGVNFGATYIFSNTDSVVRDIKVALPFPAERAVFDDLRFELDGAKWASPPAPGEGKITSWMRLAPGEQLFAHRVRCGVCIPRSRYRATGLSGIVLVCVFLQGIDRLGHHHRCYRDPVRVDAGDRTGELECAIRYTAYNRTCS